LVKESTFFSGLRKIKTSLNGQNQEIHRPSLVVYYHSKYSFEPTFIVDISESFETKMKAILSFKSQFFTGEETGEPQTYISRQEFLESIKARDKHCGSLIEAEYGEAFYIKEKISIGDPVSFFKRSREGIDKLGLSRS